MTNCCSLTCVQVRGHGGDVGQLPVQSAGHVRLPGAGGGGRLLLRHARPGQYLLSSNTTNELLYTVPVFRIRRIQGCGSAFISSGSGSAF
jgi:hypothetical protein